MAEINPADCVPKDKFDEAAVERAERLGYPGLNPILPALLEWVQDPTWPVAIELMPLLAKAGPEIAPHLITILRRTTVAGAGPELGPVSKEVREAAD
ncbi:MAG: DUF5071 domain-containing protein [Alphaproteobacteria bacterium]|nr:DUF5071 domain-containing protein [Alphaproteobacteria bacterium]